MMLGVLLTGLFVAVIVPLNVASSPAVPKRTVVITGANRGIGLEACKILAASNEWSIIMACRSRDNALEALKSIPPGDRDNIEIEDLDLADLASIKSFAERLSNSGRCINVLACNAGIQLSSSAGGKDGSQVQRTKNGFEATVGTNHLGHFYLLNLMLKTLKKQKRSRIVIMGSGVHNPEEPGGNVGSKATLGDMRGLASGFTGTVEMVDGGEYNADKAYKDSKLCNVITSLELARRLKAEGSDVTCNVMNPGLIPTTGLFRTLNPLFVFIFTILTRYVFKVAVSEDVGGRRLASMISDPALEGVSGAYFSAKPDKVELFQIAPSKEASDTEKAKKFWEYSLKAIEKQL